MSVSLLAAWFRKRKASQGMTVLELLVAMSVFIMLMAVTLPIVSTISTSWVKMSGRAELFSSARAAIGSMQSTLRQATLNPYFAYADASGQPVPLINPSAKSAALNRSQIPTQYLRSSELHFLVDDAQSTLNAAQAGAIRASGFAVFFQAPLGKVRSRSNLARSTLLNCVGYFVEYGDGKNTLPNVAIGKAGTRERYRLMQVVQPAYENTVYQSTLETNAANGLPTFNYDLKWIETMTLASNTAYKHVLAENIILLVVLPKISKYEISSSTKPLAPNYTYDSRWWEPGYTGKAATDERARNQLPPVLELVLVAIDEASAIKVEGLSSGSVPPFSGGVGVNFDSLFQVASQIEQDIKTVEAELNALRLNFRIFRTEVALPGAKWSEGT